MRVRAWGRRRTRGPVGSLAWTAVMPLEPAPTLEACSRAPAGGRVRAGAPRRPQVAAGEALALPPGRSVLTFRATLLKRGLYAARALRLGLGALTLRLAPRGGGGAGAPPAPPPAPLPAPPPLGEVGADGARARPQPIIRAGRAAVVPPLQ